MGDSNWSNVALLLGFEGSDGSTTFTDEGPNALSGTAGGNAQIDTAAFKFGSSSYLGDGVGDVVSFADSSDWYFPGQFTLECWARPDLTGAAVAGLLSQWTNSTGGCNFQFGYFYSSATSKRFQFVFSPTGAPGGTTLAQPLTNVDQSIFHHVAVDRDASDKIRLYVDGVMVASATVSGGTDVPTPLRVGAYQSVSSSSWKGWIDELRITKGVARYASDAGFSVPTAAFPRGAAGNETDLTLNVAASSGVTLVKLAGHLISASCASALTRMSGISRSVSVAAAGGVAMVRVVTSQAAAAVAATAALARQTGKALGAAVATTAGLTCQTVIALAIPSFTAVALVAGLAFSLALAVSVGSVVVLGSTIQRLQQVMVAVAASVGLDRASAYARMLAVNALGAVTSARAAGVVLLAPASTATTAARGIAITVMAASITAVTAVARTLGQGFKHVFALLGTFGAVFGIVGQTGADRTLSGVKQNDIDIDGTI